MAGPGSATACVCIVATLFVLVCGGLADIHSSHRHHHLARQDAPLLAPTLEEVHDGLLSKRDTYSCGKGSPCSNGACCGISGYCGYGPTYCGSGNCTSNCDAVAECGQYASKPGTQCPLNTCCSQYGFCGTTSDFCGTGCQSDCVLHPSPPAGGSSVSIIQNKVIGYYESWSARKDCHKVTPTDLPLDALTHVNFAFAYIDPGSYQVVTMDTSTPSSLFQDTAGLKNIKQDLKVFVSIGGWSFSDNDTATQPLYGEIAASATKRQTFANNVVQFMKQYGFDGLDIDWEYPGAPDRGGQSQDTENYILLLQTLRQTFDQSGNTFGLTFTAPSSYWYLRWFDLPKMIRYADWINLMTYDLHGVWDSTDPIGSIVQGHTNLTEIKLAAELFWRVNIPPAKIVMGFGFYGRSFTLSSPSCSTPGCPFSGASNPGPCSATGGILEYYEIEAVLAGDSSIQPTQDKDAAVMYFKFDNNQWVSYDNAATFKQKVDWANSVGLGGALIWASDTDDDKYTAHTSLLGRTIKSTPSLQLTNNAVSNPQSVIIDISASNGQGCFADTGKCVNLNDNNAMATACGAGFTVIGWDDAGCGKKNCHCGKPICCPTNAAPKDCTWRGDNNGKGSKGDCSAQCFPDEINIQGIQSSWGGGFTNDGNTDKCVRGRKSFCCPARDYTQSTSGCGWGKCRAGCPSGQVSLLSKISDCFYGTKSYCCPDNSHLSNCHWTSGQGAPDCANAICSATEIEIDRDGQGDGGFACNWNRQKAACCTVVTAPAKPAYCSADMCTILPGFCPSSDDDESANGFTKRELVLRTPNSTSEPHRLEKRGGNKDYYPALLSVIITALAYPSPPEYIQAIRAQLRQYLRTFFALIVGYCDDATTVATTSIPVDAQTPPPAGQVEHIIDRQIMAQFAQDTVNRQLPGGVPVPDGLVAVPLAFWQRQNFRNRQFPALAQYAPIGGPDGAQPGDANSRLMECFGTYSNPYPLMLVQDQINGAKGRAMQGHAPTDNNEIDDLLNEALRTGTDSDADALLESIRIGFAVFDYMNTAEGTVRWNNVRNNVRDQLGHIQTVFRAQGIIPLNVDLQQWWDVWFDAYMNNVSALAQTWATRAMQRVADAYNAAADAATARGIPIPDSFYTVTNQLVAWTLNRRVGTMTTPPGNTFQGPQPPGGAGGGGS